MQENLWNFTDNFGSFSSRCADKFKALYFPLANESVMSSVSPDLHGDIKSGKDTFLLAPVSRIDLVNLRSSRNFWVYINKDKIWSAASGRGKFNLEAGLLWHKITKENKGIGIKSEILSFVPSSGEPVEIMQVTITNISKKKIELTPIAAIPIYARGADNLRDHRHVTSLLQRIKTDKFGVIVKPTMVFNEAGHKPNKTNYFVLGQDQSGRPPEYIYPTQEMFCGEGGNLDEPEAVLEDRLPRKAYIQGKEAMGALRFHKEALKGGQSKTYIVLMGITDNPAQINKIKGKFSNVKKIQTSLKQTKDFWAKLSINVSTADKDFNNWFRWVSIQPTLRKIFGCSFLPDFDYGKGGRGWRDLWQDCLGLLITNPKSLRKLLINNFSGVRIDGSNATIIGKMPGEFIADRNDIARVWMDHGIWPLITTELYINLTRDLGILFEQAPYFWDQHVWRSRKINHNWKVSGYKGTILEHLLLENLTQFYNVGEHNHIRLEGADWNDGLDMAKERGESVAFSCMYAANLKKIAQFIRRCAKTEVKLCAEMLILLKPCDYKNIKSKQRLLEEYFRKVEQGVSGKKVSVDCAKLAKGLEEKADWFFEHIRRNEWLKEGFFNGYYDNKGKRVEGRIYGRIRMMLASQVFPIMSGVATDAQLKAIIHSVEKYLFDKKFGGIRLNTDFGREYYDLGRAFSFSYGDKENGAIFSHMVVMYAYGLCLRGFRKEGERALNSLYKLSVNSAQSKIYPCLPEYFNLEGRGMYSYLTGSASWFALALLKFSLPKS